MLRRRRYGTPLHPWARRSVVNRPKIVVPRDRASAEEALRQRSTYVVGGGIGVILLALIVTIVSAFSPPPIPPVGSIEKMRTYDGVTFAQFEGWVFAPSGFGTLDRPATLYYTAGDEAFPPMAITLYAPTVTKLYYDIVDSANGRAPDRESAIREILSRWQATDGIPAPSGDLVVKTYDIDAATGIGPVALYASYPDAPWAPRPDPTPSPEPTEEPSPTPTQPGTIPLAPTPEPTKARWLSEGEYPPSLGEPRSDTVIHRRAFFYLPLAGMFRGRNNEQRMLVMMLSWADPIPTGDAERDAEIKESIDTYVRLFEELVGPTVTFNERR